MIVGLRREVKEETSLELNDPRFVFKDKNDYFYVDSLSASDIKLSDEHSSFIFYNASLLNDLKSLTNYYKSAIIKCYKAFSTEND